MPFRIKLLLIFIAATSISTGAAIFLLERESEQALLDEIRAKILSIAETAAVLIDGDKHSKIKARQDEQLPEYLSIQRQLQGIHQVNNRSDTRIGDVYTLMESHQQPGLVIYGVDADTSLESHRYAGDVHRTHSQEVSSLSIPSVDSSYTKDEFGEWIVAKAPIRDSSGKVVAALIIEVSKERVLFEEATIMSGAVLALGLGIGIALIGALVVARRVSRPLALIQGALAQVSQGNLDVKLELASKDEFGSVAGTLLEMVQGLKERETVKSAFSRFVSHQVLQDIVKSGEVPQIRGERRRITVMFCDVRGFTTISEKLTPEQVVQILNEYFEAAVDAIFRYHGMLDKFLGDGIMAVFGAPVDDSHQEEHAVRAALEIQEQVGKLSERLKASHGLELRVGIGIHSGAAIVGTMGSSKRLEYTAIGDTVNLASRLESATKDLGVSLAISQYTCDGLRGIFKMEDLGEISVKGKTESVRVYKVAA